MEAPDSTRENGAPAHEPPGVNRLSLMCGISTWVIVAITFFALYLIYDRHPVVYERRSLLGSHL